MSTINWFSSELQSWMRGADFEAAPGICITRHELQIRWPSLTDDFLIKHIIQACPYAICGLLGETDTGTLRCRPVFLHFPVDKTDYKAWTAYLDNMTSQDAFQDYVLLKAYVEECERKHPELLQPAPRNHDMQLIAEHHKQTNCIKQINSLTTEELATENKALLVAALLTTSLKQTVIHDLVFPGKDIEENSKYKTIQRYAEKGRELLETKKA